MLSQTELTGAETYALDLGAAQVKAGHKVFLVSDKIHCATDIPVTNQPISVRTYPQRLRNIRFLRRFIKKHNIDLVHAHSRAASWVSHHAVRGQKIGYVSTVHGRQHLHLSLKLHDIYGDRIIVVSPALTRHLAEEVGMDKAKIVEIPNGLNFSAHQPVLQPSSRLRFGLLGRTSGPKGERAKEFLFRVIPALLEEFPQIDFTLAGGTIKNFDAKTVAQVNHLKERFPARFSFLGSMPKDAFHDLIANSDAVIGSGRIAIRALALKVPTFAMGESSAPGWVNEDSFDAAVYSNFGDISAQKADVKVDVAACLEEIRSAIRAGLRDSGMSERTLSHFGIDEVARRIEHQYRIAIMNKQIPRWIPVLMYHKVEPQPLKSRHRIFVTTKTFERHLDFLQRKNFNTVTFQEIGRYISGEIPWKSFPRKPVMLTFDDGYESTHRHALPALNRRNYRAVFYVLGDTRLRNNAWDADTGEEASLLAHPAAWANAAREGHEIGSHSMTHPRLTELPLAQVRAEVNASRETVRNLTGVPPSSFAYPYGNLNQDVKKIVAEEGFAFGVATDSGGTTLAHDPLQVFRVNIFPEDGPWQLWKKTSTWYRRYYRWKRGK